VGWLRVRFGFSERRAVPSWGSGGRRCATGDGRATTSHGCGERLRALAAERPRFGYRRLHALLRREGVAVNHKRVARLYRAEGLAVRRRTRKRVARDGRGRAAQPGRPNQQWGVDFVSDALAWGRRIRLFTVVDVFTREALAIEVDTALPGGRVVRVLERLAAERGAPDEIVLDNGPELAGKALDRWAYERGVGLRFIEPGRPSRTPSSRASRGGCATSASTGTGSSASPTPGRPSRRGGSDDIGAAPTARSGYRVAGGVPARASTRRRSGRRSWPDSHNRWTKQRGQVSSVSRRTSY
jgi:transposase InsO family protein